MILVFSFKLIVLNIYLNFIVYDTKNIHISYQSYGIKPFFIIAIATESNAIYWNIEFYSIDGVFQLVRISSLFSLTEATPIVGK